MEEKKSQSVVIRKNYERKVTLGDILTQYDYITHGTTIELTIDCSDAKEMEKKLSGIGDIVVGSVEKEISKNIEKIKADKDL